MRPLVFKILAAFAMFAAGLEGAWAMHDPTSGFWYGRSYLDIDGKLASCVVASRYENDHYLLFLLSGDFNWHLGVGNGSWFLATDDVVRITVEVDGEFMFAGDALAVSDTVLSLHLPAGDASMIDLRNGDVMTLGLLETTVSFALEGVGAALRALEQCVQAGPVLTQ